MPDESRLRPSLVLRGAQETTAAVGRSLRALDRDRLAALAVAVGMLLVLLAPWYEVSATARGADGSRHALRQSLSGWQALSTASVVCAIVAVATIVLLLVRSGTIVDGLGAEGRRSARSRVDGRCIAAGGALGVVFALFSLAVHPGPDTAAGVTGATSVRFGLGLALLVATGLAVLGGRIALAVDGASPRWSWPRPPGRPRRRAAARRDRDAASGEEMPSFDFVVDQRPRPGLSRLPAAGPTRTARSRSR